MMAETIQLGEIAIAVTRKDIKYVHGNFPLSASSMSLASSLFRPSGPLSGKIYVIGKATKLPKPRVREPGTWAQPRAEL